MLLYVSNRQATENEFSFADFSFSLGFRLDFPPAKPIAKDMEREQLNVLLAGKVRMEREREREGY
jgi:hypothetical protein